MSNQNSGEQVYNETINLSPGERIERALEELKEGETYLFEASSNTGETFDRTFNTTAEALEVSITDDGKLKMYEMVS